MKQRIDLLIPRLWTTWGDLMDRHGLKLAAVDACSAAMISKDRAFAIIVSLDRFTGASMCYVDLSRDQDNVYDPRYVFVNRRHREWSDTHMSLPASQGDPIEHGLACLAHVMRQMGQDVLNGDRAWMKFHHCPRSTASPEMMAACRN